MISGNLFMAMAIYSNLGSLMSFIRFIIEYFREKTCAPSNYVSSHACDRLYLKLHSLAIAKLYLNRTL